MDPPLAIDLLGDPRLARIERCKRGLDRLAHLGPERPERIARFPPLVDHLLDVHSLSPITCSSHSPTSPIRMIDEIGRGAVISSFRAVVDPHRGHSKRFGRAKILRHVVDQQGVGRVDGEALAQQRIAVRVGLGPKLAGVDVVELVEMPVYAERLEHPPGIRRIAVGEDQLAPRQPRQRRRQPLVLAHAVERDVVDVGQEVVRVDLMLGHQPGQRGAVGMEMLLLHPPRLYGIAFQQALDVGAHALVDQREQAGRCRVQAIVEVEDPVADVAELRVHGGGALAALAARANRHRQAQALRRNRGVSIPTPERYS